MGSRALALLPVLVFHIINIRGEFMDIEKRIKEINEEIIKLMKEKEQLQEICIHPKTTKGFGVISCNICGHSRMLKRDEI
jgi:hypothetical protein